MPIVDTLTIFDRVVTPIWIYDVENYRVSWANDAAVKLWSAPDKESLYRRDLSLDISQATDQRIKLLLLDTKIATQSIWWTLYPNNEATQVFIRFSNISANSEQKLLLCEAVLSHDEIERNISFSQGDSISSLFNQQGQLISCNQNFQHCYDQTTVDLEELIEMSVAQLAIKFDQETDTQFERQVINRGKISWYNFQVKLLQPEQHYLVIQNDITHRKVREQRHLHLAYHDQLTGLLNRYGLEEFLKHSCSLGHKFYLSLINLDSFKLINNNLGHKTGDEVIIAIAKRLQKQLPNRYHLARFGGDEFIIIVPADDDTQSVEAIVQLIIDTISLPIIELDSIQLTASIGTAVFPDDAENPDDLIMYAGTAMHKAKEQGSRSYCSFAQQMSLEIQRRSALQQGLKNPSIFEELVPLYQPIVDMKHNKLIGMEALLSWDSPQLGKVAPQEFVPEAERSGMMNEIGQWILTQACQQCLIWHQQTDQRLTLSVNVSAIQLNDNFIATLERVLINTKFPADCLVLELTESIFMLNIEHVIKRLKAISNRGIRICIDDFGTGYSSLSYIHKLPINTIKIDRSFIADIDSSNVVIEATMAMANKLGLNVVAEGIETQHQLEQMLKYPNLMAQGYYYSRPVNAAEFAKLPLFTKLIKPKALN